jgi:hypothetical protein
MGHRFKRTEMLFKLKDPKKQMILMQSDVENEIKRSLKSLNPKVQQSRMNEWAYRNF